MHILREPQLLLQEKNAEVIEKYCNWVMNKLMLADLDYVRMV